MKTLTKALVAGAAFALSAAAFALPSGNIHFTNNTGSTINVTVRDAIGKPIPTTGLTIGYDTVYGLCVMTEGSCGMTFTQAGQQIASFNFDVNTGAVVPGSLHIASGYSATGYSTAPIQNITISK